MIDLVIDERAGKPSASAMERLVLCPGSLRAEASAPADEGSVDAQRGTVMHAVLAGEMTAADAKLTSDEKWVVERCLELETDILEVNEFAPEREIREERMWLPPFDLYSGKPDVIYLAGERAIVIDYKTGRSPVPPAERNYQMRALAVLTAATYPDLRQVIVAIVQPRSSEPVTMAAYDEQDVARAGAEIMKALVLANDPQAPRTPGTDQCRYCRAKAQCPEARSVALAHVPMAILPELPPLTAEQFAEILPQLGMVESFCEAVKKAAKKHLQEGGTIPGYTLKPGSPRREITDPRAAWQAMPDGTTADEFMSICSVSVTKAETLYRVRSGLKGKASKEAFAEAMSGAITEKPVEPSLVATEEVAAIES